MLKDLGAQRAVGSQQGLGLLPFRGCLEQPADGSEGLVPQPPGKLSSLCPCLFGPLKLEGHYQVFRFP